MRYFGSRSLPSLGLYRPSDLGQLWALAVRLMPLLVFLVSLFFYLITLAPTIFDGLDSIEYTTSAYRLGIPHSTGYPLYLILGKAFTYLPFGDVGYRINLMSAVFAAATSMLVFKSSLIPNPPKDTDGRREGSGRGWVRELQGRWPGVLG